ncbi:MAG: amidohydrolase family protein, partial [Chloroflexales bacterium]
LETAIELVRAVVPPPGPEERQAALRLALREALSYGITSIHIMPGIRSTDGQETLADLQALRGRDELSLRCLTHISAGDLDAAIALGLRSGLGDGLLRVGGLKLFADGSLGSESAEMLSHYEGRRHLGIATIGREVLEKTVARANASGISVIIHAIGDAANRKVLDAIELARGDGDPPALAMPNRIEHCQVLHPKDIGRFAELGVIASMQPIHCTSDMATADELWGARSAHAYAWRELLESGATLAFGSDAPVETMNPWPGVHAAVTRQRPDGHPEGGWYPDQRLTVDEAIAAYCVGPAIASGEAGQKGRIAPGMRADLAVLTGDPFRSAPGELHAITAAMTLIAGNVVFER